MDFLKKLGIKKQNYGASTGLNWLKTKNQGELKIYSPTDGKYIASVYQVSTEDYDKVVSIAHKAFLDWRNVPAPKRGEVVRQIGDKLRKYKDPLGHLVSYEMGKSLQEGLGEV
ncbi:MAG: aldehyde dehydrogenase family protein, partial [Ignavibacteriae bacterium]|nr:aldehyde dehydrogenase family protein [Ignavibacteriota bacterium]